MQPECQTATVGLYAIFVVGYLRTFVLIRCKRDNRRDVHLESERVNYIICCSCWFLSFKRKRLHYTNKNVRIKFLRYISL